MFEENERKVGPAGVQVYSSRCTVRIRVRARVRVRVREDGPTYGRPLSPTAAAPTAYGCSLHGLRLQPPPPTVAGTRATRRRSGWRRCRASPSGCPHLPISPSISLYLPLSQVSGVPFGLPGQILGTNAEQAQVRAARGGGSAQEQVTRACCACYALPLLCTHHSPLATYPGPLVATCAWRS